MYKGKQSKENTPLKDVLNVLRNTDVWLTLSEIESKTGRNFNTVKKAVYDLKETGIIEVIAKEGTILVKLKGGGG